MTHWRSGLRKHGFHHDEQCDENVAIIDSLVVALDGMVRTFNAPTIDPLVAFAVIENARAALASVER